MKNLILFSLVLLGLSASATELSKMIPYPFHAVQDGSVNSMLFIDDGLQALAKRLEMVRRAKHSIEAEYFIYNTDTASRIFSKELVAAADRGVRVRLLIDKSAPIFVFDKHYARELIQHGIDVRYYNDAAFWQISTEQFRNHRKLLVIDDDDAITGGRNIADEYFDLHHEFNFEDSDLYIRGPLVKVMRESFDLFFANHMSVKPHAPSKPTAEAVAFLKETTALERDALARLDLAGRMIAAKPLSPCPKATFSSDAPGANLGARLKSDFIDKYRFLRKTLFDKISAVDRGIVISSPYLIDGRAVDEMLDILKDNKVKVAVYTNSLGSTDAFYVAANMYLSIKSWRKAGVRVVLHDGHYLEKESTAPAWLKAAASGTHSKVHIYETSTGNEVMVGTYNVDHRSNYYNAEMAVFCKGSDELTNEIAHSVGEGLRLGLQVSPDASYVVDRNGEKKSIYAASKAQIWKMKLFTLLSRFARELL